VTALHELRTLHAPPRNHASESRRQAGRQDERAPRIRLNSFLPIAVSTAHDILTNFISHRGWSHR